MTVHHVKCWPKHFQAVWDGAKTAELRRDDRGYAVDDILVQHEWDREAYDEAWREEERLLVGDPISRPDVWNAADDRARMAAYTGRQVIHRISHILRGGPWLVEGYAMLSVAAPVRLLNHFPPPEEAAP